MFRDKEDALRRLEALLQEEETEEDFSVEEEETEEDFSDEEEETEEAFSDEEESEEDPTLYRNWANQYHVYNTDRTDVDLEEYSEQIQTPDRQGGCLLSLAVALMLGIVGILVLFVLRFKGIL